jgi:type II secretion system protein N
MFTPLFSIRNLLYLLYGAGLLIVLLYVRFPVEKFKVYCERQIEYYLDITQCSIKKIDYRFPFTVVFENVRLEENDDELKNIVELSDLIVTPQVKKPWSQFEVQAVVYGGKLQSDLTIGYKTKRFQLENIKVSGVKVEELMNSLQLVERKIGGELKFTGVYRAGFASPFTGEGECSVVISEGSIQFAQPILELEGIDFTQLEFQLTQDGENIRLKGGALQSEKVKAAFNGDIKLDATRVDSQLDLSGSLDPARALYTQDPGLLKYVTRLERRYNMKALPFRIGGTVKNPTFRFGK